MAWQEQDPGHWVIHSSDQYQLSSRYELGAGLGVWECHCEQDIELRVAGEADLAQGCFEGQGGAHRASLQHQRSLLRVSEV